MTKAKVVYGLGIGCHQETALAYQQAGAEVSLIHIKDLLESSHWFSDTQILNISGGFLHGDILGSAMCASAYLEHNKLTDILWDFSEKGGVIYGQCNGFQLLVKSGLLPGIDKTPALTLSDNACGSYRVDYVPHKVTSDHFAFSGLKDLIYLWCRHGEGRVTFNSDFSSYSKKDAAENTEKILEDHVLLQYINPQSLEATQEFPFNPNGSEYAIAGLKSSNCRIFGHMAHPEVSVFASRNPEWFREKEAKRRGLGQGKDLEFGRRVFSNIVEYF